jgi:autotransporter-associated beta strand protein
MAVLRSKTLFSRLLGRWAILAAATMLFPLPLRAYDLSFDYTSFETGFQQPQFNALNYPGINGRYMMTSTDNHRPEMVANGNALAQFYNNFNADYNHPDSERRTPAEEAAFIHNYVTRNSTDNGPRPEWLILNEISASQWQLNPGVPSLSKHRTWVIDTVTLLNDVYGYKVITYSPYETVGTANAPSWQALAAKSYVAIESYQSGTEVWNSGATNAARLAWVQGRYQASKNTYRAAGVPESRLFVSEHFANNNATYVDNQGVTRTTGWGRAGLASASDWDQVIMMRQDAMYNVGFAGFLAYNWGGNAMGVTQAEQIQHEYYYRSRRVLASQKPQWLSDGPITVNGATLPLSWNQPLNWLGGVPNAVGAEVNFWRTLKANRTVTLDGAKTVGILTFDSAFSYTIGPGTGGTLVFNRSGAVAALQSNDGDHTIATNVQLVSDVEVDVATDMLTIGGTVSGPGSLTKSGAGVLTLTNLLSYSGETSVDEGTLRLTGRFLPDTGSLMLASGAALQLNFSGIPDVVDSLFINGAAQSPGIWGPLGSVAEFTTPLLTGTGRLQVTTGPLPGDFNSDGAVDAADYVLWRKQLGSPYTETHYNTWRSNYAEGDGGSGLGGDSVHFNVPEPMNVVLLITAAYTLLLHWSNAQRCRPPRSS